MDSQSNSVKGHEELDFWTHSYDFGLSKEWVWQCECKEGKGEFKLLRHAMESAQDHLRYVAPHCHNLRHSEPCPLPCAACQAECT